MDAVGSKAFLYRAIGICAALSVVLAATFFVLIFLPRSYADATKQAKEEVRFHIDAITRTPWNVRVIGWAFQPGLDTDRLRSTIVLQGANGSFRLNTRFVQRPDLTTVFAAAEKKAHAAGPGPQKHNAMQDNESYSRNTRYLLNGERVFYDRAGFEAVGFTPFLRKGRYSVCIAYDHGTTTTLYDTGLTLDI